MIEVPVPTIEKPLTPIDYMVPLEKCLCLDDIQSYAERVPVEVRMDERFGKAVAKRLAAIADRKAAA